MYQEIEEENIQKELNFNQDYFNPDPNNENNNISTRIDAQNGTNGMNDSLTEEKPKNKDENVKYIFLKDVSESPKLEDKKHITTQKKENKALNENQNLMEIEKEEPSEKEKEEKKETKKSQKVIYFHIDKEPKNNQNNSEPKKPSRKPSAKPLFKVDKIQQPIQNYLAERNNNTPNRNNYITYKPVPPSVRSNINSNIIIPLQDFEINLNQTTEIEDEDLELNQEHISNINSNQQRFVAPSNIMDNGVSNGFGGNNNAFNFINYLFGKEDQITLGQTQIDKDLI